jgi:CubicO group peptidase (beta-lactamase class C family)
MQKKLIIGLLLLGGVYLLLLLTGNKHVPRTLWMTIFHGKMGPDIDELNDFPVRKISKLQAKVWPLSSKYNTFNLGDEQAAKLKAYETTAIVAIHKDSLLFEWYDLNYDAKTVSNSFSMAKSFTASLIGIALKEGFIKSLDEPIGNYIEAYAVNPYDKITIRHALMMSSGLDFKEDYGSMFSWPAKAYYGKDVNATILNPTKVSEPGEVYAYKGGDTQLLGMVLEKATGKRVATYAAEKLWRKMGAEADAFWSLDIADGMEKVSCCFYATARDFARFGKLYMNYGKWENEQLLDSAYIALSLRPGAPVTSTGKINTEYGYQWWLLNYKNNEVFYARGIKGQYIFVVPAKELILVRLGHKRAEKKGDELPSDIFEYLDLAAAITGY